MDPFVATIVKQGLVLGAAIGVIAFGVFFLVKMAGLEQAMLNNIYPHGLES